MIGGNNAMDENATQGSCSSDSAAAAKKAKLPIHSPYQLKAAQQKPAPAKTDKQRRERVLSIFNTTFDAFRSLHLGTTLSCRCSRSTTNEMRRHTSVAMHKRLLV